MLEVSVFDFNLSSKNQLFIILVLIPVRCSELAGGAHRGNFRQGTQCDVASLASRWRLVSILTVFN